MPDKTEGWPIFHHSFFCIVLMIFSIKKFPQGQRILPRHSNYFLITEKTHMHKPDIQKGGDKIQQKKEG